jgi:hypothetical protein
MEEQMLVALLPARLAGTLLGAFGCSRCCSHRWGSTA